MIKPLAALSLTLLMNACTNLTSYEGNGKHFVYNDITRAWRNSYQDWQELKKSYQLDYSYERDSNYSTQFNSSTKFEIINDQVEFRHFFEWQTGSSPSLSWTESYANLNSHNQGSTSKTIDQLYHQCQTEILNKPSSSYDITFGVDQFNILKECSYTKRKCQSGCTKGIRIQGLSMKRKKH